MGSTKIINVLRDDSLKEILELFRNTPAQEVIFVLPKKSKAFKGDNDFGTLKNEAEKLGKTVSLLCSSPELNLIGKGYGFEILTPKEATPRLPKIKVANYQEPDSDDEEAGLREELNPHAEGSEEDEDTEEGKGFKYADNPDEEEPGLKNYKAVTTASRTSRISANDSRWKQSLDDIIRPSERKNIKVAQKKETQVNLDVKIDSKPILKSDPEFENIWQSIDRKDNPTDLVGGEDKSFWDKISFSDKSSTKKQSRKFTGRDRSKKVVMTLGVASLVLISTILYVSLGSARILINPRKETLNLQLKVSVSDKFSTVDSSFNKIPGQLFNIEKSSSQTFPATGQKEVAQKARGIMTVYNGYGSTSQVLIATTRFESKDGLIFRTLKNITIPGSSVQNGKVVPGSITVEVIADKPGQTYNIEAGQFTIPAFKEKGDMEKYQKIYGKSDQPMKGGVSGLAKVVTPDDYNSAKSSLTQNVLKEISEALKSQTTDFKIVNSSSTSIESVDSTAQADEAADSFNMTVKGSVVTVGFKQADLNELIKNFIEKTGSQTVIPEKLNLGFDKVSFDKNQSVLTFTVTIRGNSYSRIYEDKIEADLMGKTSGQIKEYFANSADIESVKVVLSPFWVKKMPKNKDKIKFEINYQ